MHVAKPIINKRPPIQPTTLIMFRKNMALIVKTCSSQERFDKSKPFGNLNGFPCPELAGSGEIIDCNLIQAGRPLHEQADFLAEAMS